MASLEDQMLARTMTSRTLKFKLVQNLYSELQVLLRDLSLLSLPKPLREGNLGTLLRPEVAPTLPRNSVWQKIRVHTWDFPFNTSFQ